MHGSSRDRDAEEPAFRLTERQEKKSLLSSHSQPPNHVMQKRNKQILDSDLSGQSHVLEAHWTCNNAGIVCR